MTSKHELYVERLQQVVSEFRQNGWVVDVEPKSLNIPGLDDIHADFVARSGDELVIGEVKFRSSPDVWKLSKLAARIESMPNARLDVHWLGEPDPEPSAEHVLEMAKHAEQISVYSSPAALLLACASLEGALHLLAKWHDLAIQGRGLRSRVSYLYSVGYLTPGQYAELDRAIKVRNVIAHGVYEEPSADVVQHLCHFVRRAASGEITSTDEMVSWFLRNHEPALSARRGWPEDAADVLREQYPHAEEDEIKVAVESIESKGIEWSRKYSDRAY